MDVYSTIETTNASSIAKIDQKAKEVEVGVLARLDQLAEKELEVVDMNRREYNKKLTDVAKLRRTFAGVIQGQVARKQHQWAVKTKFYEADVDSRRIFEEVQQRIKDQTAQRMDEAKQQVAEEIQAAAQRHMDSTKAAIAERVAAQYQEAR